MDGGILNALAGFDRVWERVGGESVGATPDAAETLTRFIDAEAAAAALFSRLAAMRGKADDRRVLAAVAARDRRHMALLQLEYFLLTGDSRAPAPAPAADTRGLAALREAYKGKLAAADAYADTAAALPELGGLLSRIGCEEELAAAETRRLIANAMDCMPAGGLQ